MFLSPERLAVFCTPNALTVLTWRTDDEREVRFELVTYPTYNIALYQSIARDLNGYTRINRTII